MMNKTIPAMTMLASGLLMTDVLLAGSGGGWVDFSDETAVRLSVDSNLGAGDVQEKDYAVGDVDGDGDSDLVIVRKEPFTSEGRDINLLLMNEGGVLVDRTSAYATASDVAGDQGFLTPTNDRDVKLADLNGDGWLDVVTATTLTDNDSKHLSHPRVYINLGEDNGIWQGFRYEDGRIPRMHPTAGPRFCSVAAGDMDGDGDLDLYFGDYDSGPTQIYDYNNKLLINDGNGYFTDQSDARLTFEMRESAFGAASVIADMNDDGALDVVKQTSLNPPQHVAITYNDPGNQGWFVGYEIYDERAPYFVETGDLNGDGRLDMIVTDDGVDAYYLNTGNGSDGYANFNERTFDSITNGFGGDAYIVDLNNDGNQDVIITDVDVDIPGCSRETHIFRNRGDVPDVTFSLEPTGLGVSQRTGVHDVALIDINGDGWMDMVVGRCASTEVWMNQPPTGIVFSYPDGLPGYIAPGQAYTLRFQLDLIGEGAIEPGSGRMFLAVDGGSANELTLEDLGGNAYRATLPAGTCTQKFSYWFQASMTGEGQFTDPPAGAASPYSSIIANGSIIVQREEFEAPPSPEWTVENDPSLETGAWERVDPDGTIYGQDQPQPEDDATAGSDAVICYITQNGTDPGSPGEADVDGGPTRLLSPVFSLEDIDGTIAYSRWMYDSQSTDELITEISNDGGGSWTFVQATLGTNQSWETASFIVGDFVVPTSQMRLRFSVQDAGQPSLVEAGIDNVSLEVLDCEVLCPGDVDGSGTIDVDDLLTILAAFGSTDAESDLDGNGVVDVNDVLIVIAGWGAC
ncbi:MAG: FG-GAP-like repeat-containing protein [Phycisphaerales bacterium]|nr:FG-GAP-like repeat-containing protein [Phycisphaerales bacterium]